MTTEYLAEIFPLVEFAHEINERYATTPGDQIADDLVSRGIDPQRVMVMLSRASEAVADCLEDLAQDWRENPIQGEGL